MTLIIFLLEFLCGVFIFVGKYDIAIPLGIVGAFLLLAVWMDS